MRTKYWRRLLARRLEARTLSSAIIVATVCTTWTRQPVTVHGGISSRSRLAILSGRSSLRRCKKKGQIDDPSQRLVQWPRAGGAQRGPRMGRPQSKRARTLRSFPFLYLGEVDINSSSRGQPSHWAPGVGGWFTSRLCNDLPLSSDWHAVFGRLCKDTKYVFDKKPDQNPEPSVQDPEAFRLDIKLATAEDKSATPPWKAANFTWEPREFERQRTTWKAAK